MRTTRAYAGAALLLALGLFSCSRETDSLVVVTAIPADGTTTGLDTLIVSVGKTSQTFALPSPLTTSGAEVGIYVPGSQTGSQTVTATATHATGNCSAGYQSSKAITIAKAGDTVSVSITMAAQTSVCPPTTGSTGTGGRGTGGTGTGGHGTGGTGGSSGSGGTNSEPTPDFSNCTEIDHGTAGACTSCTLGDTNDVAVYGAAISPDGTTVVTGGTDGRVKVWTNTNGVLTAQGMVLSGSGLGAVAFSPDGSMLAIGRTGSVDVVSTSTWMVIRSLVTASGQEAYGVAFSPDGTEVFTIAVASSGVTGTLYVHAVGNTQAQATETLTVPYGLGVSPVAVSGAFPVAVTDENGDVSIYTWSPSAKAFTGPVSLTVTTDGSTAEAAAFSANGAVFASGGDDGTLSLWNFPTSANALPDGQIAISALTFSSYIDSLAFSPKNGYVAVGGGSFGSLTAYSLADGSEVGVEYDTSYDVYGLAFSAKSNLIVGGEADCGCVVVCPQ